MFEQASAEHGAGEWTIGHRLRFEQRFQGPLPDPPAPSVERCRYHNRTRYELSVLRPLSRASYLQMSVEPSLRFGIKYHG